ncbi:b(0,+)-type amino acid transporter 1 [Blattella germanica]|nr:b(0,+)-type amino acid transporter 1 [Blattella germanica]
MFATDDLHSRGIAQIANSKEVLPVNSTESLSTTKSSGIFISPSIALELSGSIGLCLIIWIICGFISLLGALAFAELSVVVPRSGAEYAYLLEAYGKLHKFWGPLPAFVSSWLHVFILSPSSSAVIIMTFSEYICQPFAPYMTGLGDYDQEMVKKIIAILGLGLLTYINLTSVKLYVRTQNVFTISKVIVCLVVIIGGLVELTMGNTTNLTNIFEGSTTNPKNLALAFYGCLWSYGGWSAITIVTEEVKNPAVNIPRSIITALPLVTCIYLMMNLAYMTVLTIPEIISAPAVAVLFGEHMHAVMKFIIPLGVAISTFGCALSGQFTITRLCYVASTEGHMMEAFSYIHVRRLTPVPAVILQVPLIMPIVTILVALFLCLVPIITDPSPLYFIALFLIVLGFILYVTLVYYKFRPTFMGK